MYYPYFRGRQNELLCLRELLESNKLSEKIIPVIEPVRFNSTFFTTLEKFINRGRKIILINNPEVGKFFAEKQDAKDKIIKETDEKKKAKLERTFKNFLSTLKDEHLLSAYILNDSINKKIINGELNSEEVILINKDKGNYSFYLDRGKELEAILTFIPKDEDFKDEVVGKPVILEDVYNKARRNVDYLAKPDDMFSKNHLVYHKRGYQGFSDFSIVGNEYEESGFAPLAIAIHIVYFDKKEVLRIHHFVSESNENTSDLARKFEEAAGKIIEWDNLQNITMTSGLSQLISCYEHGRFPGLGVIKKYSLMHHLELMGTFLEAE